MVEYFRREALPHKAFFHCERMRATLASDSCAAMWRRAESEDDGLRSACRLCPIGAVHAGEVAASMSPLKGARVCARCHQGTTRLISGHLCPSCYNRDREFVLGKNARGTPIVKLRGLAQRRIRYRCGDAIQTLAMARAMDTDELMVAALRDNRQHVVFAFNASVPPAVRQARLW